jgi:hypothetical protein
VGGHKRQKQSAIQALEADIRSWIADWNTNPRPFIWTKTAEEILDSLARCCRRVSGAAH